MAEECHNLERQMHPESQVKGRNNKPLARTSDPISWKNISLPDNLKDAESFVQVLEKRLSKTAQYCISLALEVKSEDREKDILPGRGYVFISKKNTRHYHMSGWGVERLSNSPVIYPEMFDDEYAGSNINGPSVIRVPDWINNTLGKYYMYFAHHKGNDIRLAYTDNIEGDWHLSPMSILRKGEHSIKIAEERVAHVASPDVHIDNESRLIILFFHAAIKGIQMTHVATSSDGLQFHIQPQTIANFYLRVLQRNGTYYGLAKYDFNQTHTTAELLMSESYNQSFSKVKNVLPQARHTAWLVQGSSIHVIYSRVADHPEHLRVASVDENWDFQDIGALIKPEMEYECADFSVIVSKIGKTRMSNGLRDPCIFQDGGIVYLFYAVCGEHGIGVARITPTVDVANITQSKGESSGSKKHLGKSVSI